MNVAQLMERSVETCGPDDRLSQAAGKMWDRDIGCLPVVSAEGQVLAVITDRDICMAGYMTGRPLDEVPVSTAMSRELFSCAPDDSLIAAEEVMRFRQIRRLPVIDGNGKLAGLLSLNDLAREAEREAGRTARAISGEEVSATLAEICHPRRAEALQTVA